MTDRIAKSLSVFWNGRLVGSYDKFESGAEQFAYDADYLRSSDAQPISHSLPLREDAYGSTKIRPFFSGLLPEESQRTRIATYLGIPELDDFAFLQALGGECAGALTILPKGEFPQESKGSAEFVQEDELVRILESLPLRPLLAGEEGLRLSLAGAQSKLPVIVQDGKIALPKGGCPSTHILKPELLEWFKGIAANEHCCMSVARRIGLTVPKTELIKIGKYPCVLVERYDRLCDAATGKITRIHQEDFCQAMGFPPERKYQIDGGPVARDVVRLLRSGWSSAPAPDLLRFVDLLIFNAIIGNADAHAKNYSMLYRDGARRLAPGYDLVSTVYWPTLAKSPAMKIGGADSMDSICVGHWKKLAAELNLSFAQLQRRMRELKEGVLSVDAADMNLPSECEEVLSLIKFRAAKFFTF